MRVCHKGVAALFLLALLPGCYSISVSVEPPEPRPLRKVSKPPSTYLHGDDLSFDRLRQAAEKSRDYFGRTPDSHRYALGRDAFTTEQVAASVDAFMHIVETTPPEKLGRRLARECRVYAPTSKPRFTAYYEPVLTASREPDENFRYPVYEKPDELTLVRLANFYPDDSRRIHGRVEAGELLPFLTREQIDGRRRLEGRGLELAYVDDPVALYFLHIQGSGRLRLDDGGLMRVNFAASNGLPYTSIGRYMLDNGIIKSGSSGAIREFLASHPDQRDEVLFKNRRYIFFREVQLDSNDGPIGSLGVPLVAGRSIAADDRYVPPGSVVYISSKRPRTDESGRLLGWEEFGRFVFSHDSGAAIKGPGRADIYWGEGEAAGQEAGYMSQTGKFAVVMCGVRPAARNRANAAGVDFNRVAWADLAPDTPLGATSVAQR